MSGLLIHVAGIARVVPTLAIQRFAGLLRLLVIAFEARFGADQNLLILGDLDLDAGHDHTHRLEAHIAAQVHRAEGLGRAVKLPQFNPDRAEEADNIRTQHRPRRQHIPRPRQAELVPQRLKNRVLAQPARQSQRRRNCAVFIFQVDSPIGDRHEYPIHQPVQQAAVIDAKLHNPRQIFPYAAGKEQAGRRDLAHIRRHCLRSFGEVHLHAVEQMRGEAESLLRQPSHRTEGQPIIRLPRIDIAVVQGVPVDQLKMRHFGEFGQARRARCHAQDDRIHRLCAARHLIELVRRLLPMRRPDFL